MGVGAGNDGNPAVEIMSERKLFRGRFGMDVNEHSGNVAAERIVL